MKAIVISLSDEAYAALKEISTVRERGNTRAQVQLDNFTVYGNVYDPSDNTVSENEEIADENDGIILESDSDDEDEDEDLEEEE